MTDKAPERIWMHAEAVNQEAERFWVANRSGVGDFKTEYVRADIHQALEEKTYKAGFDDGCAHIKEDYAAGDRIDFRRIKALEAERDRLREALEMLLRMEDEASPFGGEMYRDRVDRTWERARAALEGKQ